MPKNFLYRVKVITNLIAEHIRIFVVKIKILLYLILLCGVCILCYVFIRGNWQFVTEIYKDSTLVGIIGTLLGAIIGGIFTLVGSLCVGKQQIKAQNQIRRKNVIYKPLYDELAEIHNLILKDNPYPLLIDFQKGSQTILRHPQFVVWGRIKADSRYLETPKKLARLLDCLEDNVRSYLSQRHEVNNVVTKILNNVLMREVETTCTIMNIGDVLLHYIVSDASFDLFKELHDSLNPRRAVDEETCKRIQDAFVAECKEDSEIISLQERYISWIQAEEDALALLAAMIKYTNAAYEE